MDCSGCNGFLGDWPFVSGYVLKNDLTFSASGINIEVIDGVGYIFGYIRLQNGTMCLTDLSCSGIA